MTAALSKPCRSNFSRTAKAESQPLDSCRHFCNKRLLPRVVHGLTVLLFWREGENAVPMAPEGAPRHDVLQVRGCEIVC